MIDFGGEYMLKFKRAICCIVVVVVLFSLFSSPLGVYAKTYGRNGDQCYDENADTGLLIVGDSRCCQLFNYDNEGASFAAVWGGHYNFSGSFWIDSPMMRGHMEDSVKNSISKTGNCTTFVFATVNDWGATSNHDVSSVPASVNNLISAAEAIYDMTGESGGKTKHPTVYVVSMVAQKGVESKPYNDVLEKKIKGNSKIKGYVDISSCLSGDNFGFLSDGLHYNDDTLSSIWKKVKEVKDGGSSSGVIGNEDSDIAQVVSGVTWTGLLDETAFVDRKLLIDEGVNLPSFSDLSVDDGQAVREWSDDIGFRAQMSKFLWLRQVLIFVGILITIYSVLLYVAYHFDVINSFFDFELLKFLTLGKLAVSPDQTVSTYSVKIKTNCKGVVHKDMIFICLMGVSVGVLILSGKMFLIINMAIQFIQAKLGT